MNAVRTAMAGASVSCAPAGVRASPGAATSTVAAAQGQGERVERTSVAAAGDGRTPLVMLVPHLLALLFASANAFGQSGEQVAGGVLRVGTIDHFAISEGSGLTASRRYPGVIWTHNDGGYQFLFALTEAGDWLGGFQVVGANLIDWEALAADNQGNLYLADIGSNGIARTHVAVHRVKEPNPARGYGNAEVNRTWYLRFPDHRLDCEAFFVHDGYGYLITKPRAIDDRVTMFRYPLSSGSSSTLLEEVARFQVTASVTDASISVDGERLGVLTSQGAYLFSINGSPESIDSAQREFTPFLNDFMEGGTFVDHGFLVSAETRELWLFTNGNFRCESPPGFSTPLVDRPALVGGVVVFDPRVMGCPQPVFTWSLNSFVLAGQTNSTLVLSDVTAADAGLYDVTASNIFGIATSAAFLSVRGKPDVRITEVMPSPAISPGVPTADWWELTSFEAFPVDLSEWRFNDSVGGLTDPYVFGAGPIIAPGESIVFLEGLTPADFRTWWGDSNLPPALQIVTYSGSGLSFRITGDTLFLWDNVGTDPSDTVGRADFGAADAGVTFNYDPATQQFEARSVLGVNGVIAAATAPDIGSPGRIVAPGGATPQPTPVPPPKLRMLGGTAPDSIRIEFEAVAGHRYSLEITDSLAGGIWLRTGDTFQSTTNVTSFFERDRTGSSRFYRLSAATAPATN
jgi:hypothetical protein